MIRLPKRYKLLLRDMRWNVRASIQKYRKHLLKTSWAEVEALLIPDPPLVKEAWIQMRGWYRDVEYCSPTPSRVTITHMTADILELYRRVTPPMRIIPVALDPFPIGKSVSEEVGGGPGGPQPAPEQVRRPVRNEGGVSLGLAEGIY